MAFAVRACMSSCNITVSKGLESIITPSFSHLSHPLAGDDTYLEALDNRLQAYIEIVQGYGEDSKPFDQRPKCKDQQIVERVDRWGNLLPYVEEDLHD